jgi:UDP-N-acetylglucosamine diphosphorylase / glucose-1-phosphate thymidylyltransferase / UDP-N-acetylgalactosamine diphosphorylase / glucosamine-1-phosphate N-acetyltransferase / galactosamine-1-phosphate N-acetyltransferase
MISTHDFFNIGAFPFAGVFEGVKNVWAALARIGEFLKAWKQFEIEGEVMAGAWLQGAHIGIGRGTVVEPGALIKGRALIGENCEIRQGAYIRGNVIIGDNCVVGHTTEVKNAIFLNGAKAGHFAYVGDSILGNDVNLGAGTKLANFKVDTGNRYVSVEVNGKKIDTGLRKMGAIIGDGAELGCNTVTMPGALIGPGALVYPNATVRGCVPPRTMLKVRQSVEFIERR